MHPACITGHIWLWILGQFFFHEIIWLYIRFAVLHSSKMTIWRLVLCYLWFSFSIIVPFCSLSAEFFINIEVFHKFWNRKKSIIWFCFILIICRLQCGNSSRDQRAQKYWLQNKHYYILSCFNMFQDLPAFFLWMQNLKRLRVFLLKVLWLVLHTICFGICFPAM